ncbi:MAG: hypothetical protein AUG91_09565 [Actinobacteria bacterium 13_1_20CM_4_69_9]|nr:MAG: hypothetical protein AUG91_09565 [Actinobacteria bacterium 13_1_20CM_4_69_9]
MIENLPGARADQVYTHASWASNRASSYERLEFLGDSVLELAIARELYERYPDFSEGRLAKIRSHVVSRASCAVVARQLGLGERLEQRGADIPDDELHRLAHNRNVLAALHYKTELQEALARRGQSVNYSVLDVEGPPHNRRFRCAAVIDGEQLGEGAGESKKAAEQEAAKQALAKLGVEIPAG